MKYEKDKNEAWKARRNIQKQIAVAKNDDEHYGSTVESEKEDP